MLIFEQVSVINDLKGTTTKKNAGTNDCYQAREATTAKITYHL